jgi:hypothetical protein
MIMNLFAMPGDQCLSHIQKETKVMFRNLPISLAAALAAALLAQGSPSAAFAASKPKEIVVVGSRPAAHRAHDRFNGRYLLTSARHYSRVSKVDGFAVKQKVSRFNPKELAVEQTVPWK